MMILSHRGYWQHASEKNQEIAFRRSFELGFGTETDIRDCRGELVISHDIPTGGEMTLRDLLSLSTDGVSLPLALNIKADGLVGHLKSLMGVRTDWFVFDMSVPDMRSYLEAGIPVFARMSEVEKDPIWFERVVGIWLDAFFGHWFGLETVSGLLGSGKKVCVVSPELHKRDHLQTWDLLYPLRTHPSFMLCTDFPEQARKFFGVLP